MPKTKISGVVSTFILCYGFWVLLTWSFNTQELIAGGVVSLAVALFSSRFFIHENGLWFFNPVKLATLLAYVLGVFMWELIKANVNMAKICFKGCKDINPGVIRVPVDLKSEYAQSMLANSITLTPGTITLDIAEDVKEKKTYYYIHWINVESKDPVEAGNMIKGTMENWIRRIWTK